ncbi:MAG: Asp-tRNA(Asn)/Glu-tRNA(Gln) amidotransferase subunit GatA [bacterium]
MELNKLTLAEAFVGLRNKKFTSQELTKACFDQIKKYDSKIKAYITLNEDEAMAQAKTADDLIANGGELPPLLGIPVAIKDIFCTKGLRSTAASKMLANYIPPFDATVVKKIREQGGVILGKVNMDEFAMGGSTENSGFFLTANPWDYSRVPGGSSGGSAAAVTADMAIYSLGTDTGGSIRQPAAFCGTSGIKVTYGRVSRYGAMAMTSSLDTIGPFGKTVEDIAIIMQQLAGHDDLDSTTPNIEVDDYCEEIKKDLRGLKVGLPKEYFIEGMDLAVRENVLAVAKKLEDLGAELIDVSLPHTDLAVAAYYVICPSEVSSNMARYDGIRYGLSEREGDLNDIYLNSREKGFGAEVKRRIMIGTYALSSGYYDAYYKQAMKIRTLVKEDFDKAFEEVDVILTPTTPTTAFKIGENANDPLKMYLGDIFTIPASLAGVAGLAIPSGFVDGLPVGVQILGKCFDEKTVLRAGHQFQLVTDYHKQKPNLK